MYFSESRAVISTEAPSVVFARSLFSLEPVRARADSGLKACRRHRNTSNSSPAQGKTRRHVSEKAFSTENVSCAALLFTYLHQGLDSDHRVLRAHARGEVIGPDRHHNCLPAQRASRGQRQGGSGGDCSHISTVVTHQHAYE